MDQFVEFRKRVYKAEVLDMAIHLDSRVEIKGSIELTHGSVCRDIRKLQSVHGCAKIAKY